VAVAVAVDEDVPVPDNVAVLVGVEVEVAVADDEALNVPEAVSEPEIDCVLLLVPVAVAVPVPVGVTDEVDVAVDVAVPVAVASAAPSCSRTSQRYVVAVSETEIIDNESPASANVALTSGTAFNPFEALTTAFPPPSVFNRRINRIPGLVGLARTRVSFEAPVVISQTCKSALARIVPPSPGSAMTFGPR